MGYMEVFDMKHSPIQKGDEVTFRIDDELQRGIVNFIINSKKVRINSLCGEFIRNGRDIPIL